MLLPSQVKPILVASVAALALAAANPACAADIAARQQQMAETRKKMEIAKVLARAGKKTEAIAMMRSLFPSGPRGGETALEYYRIIGSVPQGWNEARVGLERLVRAEPYVMLYRRELARHLATRDATREAGIRALAALARMPDADRHLTMEAWRDALASLGGGPDDMRLYREYLEADPSSVEIREHLARAQRNSLLLAAQDRSLALSGKGELEEAERVLAEALRKNPDDPQTIGETGLIRLRQGRHTEARELFERALGLDADNRGKWKSLIATADFWKLMRESSAARDVKNLDLAEEKARAALRLDPRNADGVALLGGIAADRGDPAEAERLFRRAIALDPANGAAIRGLVGLLSGQGKRAEAIALLDGLRSKHGEAAGKYARIRADILRDDADARLAAGRVAEAEALLVEALSLAPDDAWVRFDLARLYQKKGRAEQARTLMMEGVNIAPDDPQMLHAGALLLAGLDETAGAVLLLERIPTAEQTPSMLRLHRKTTLRSQVRQAAVLHRLGKHADAAAMLERSAADAGNDPEFVNILANAWIEHGDAAHAVSLMRDLLRKESPPSAALRLYYASLLNRVEHDDELASLLEQLAAEKEWTSGERKELLRLGSSLDIRRAEAQRKTGNHAEALRILAHILERDAENLDARLSLARVMRANGNEAAASREIGTALAGIAADDIDRRLTVADRLIGMNDLGTARQILDQLAAAGPDARVLALHGQIARAEGRYDDAMYYFRQAGADEEIARLERRREGRMAAGYDVRSKPGTGGVSAFTATELPIEARIPLGYGAHALFHLDPVSADAGMLSPADTYTLVRYGQIQALAPGGIPGAPRQSARGVAVAAGYETDDWRMDIGTTPLGFPVQDIVGGFKTYRSMDPFYCYLDVARRPMTSSLVSYAGARDPVSGEVWGGVRSNGADFRVGFERGQFDSYVNFGYHLLTGRNVLNNMQFELRTGANWAFLRQEDMRLSAGLVLTHWRYRDDLSYYTFGHGGYYSPQTYYSLATPVSWEGRTERWSYMLKGSVSFSASRTKDMPFYPTRADLQALAGNPYHAGGNGHGMGYSLDSALEYKAAPNLFVGGRIEIDRSDYYTPNFVTLYLRYMFDDRNEPPPYPPAPMKPYSRF